MSSATVFGKVVRAARQVQVDPTRFRSQTDPICTWVAPSDGNPKPKQLLINNEALMNQLNGISATQNLSKCSHLSHDP